MTEHLYRRRPYMKQTTSPTYINPTQPLTPTPISQFSRQNPNARENTLNEAGRRHLVPADTRWMGPPDWLRTVVRPSTSLVAVGVFGVIHTEPLLGCLNISSILIDKVSGESGILVTECGETSPGLYLRHILTWLHDRLLCLQFE